MSDQAVEPGAPAGSASTPKSSDGSASKEVSTVRDSLPSKVTSLTSQTDRLLLRLNRLLASPGGVSSFLGTLNYTLYLLAYLETKTPSLTRLSQLLLNLLNYRRETPSLKSASAALQPTPAGPSHIASLGALLSSTRTTLRLFGLFPLYAWMRTLLQGPKPGQDNVLYSIAFTQCASYIAFQGLENIAFLTDRNVLPQSFSARFNKSGTTAKIYLWSYRAWMGGLVCDFFRLAREAQVNSQKRAGRASGEKNSVSVREEDEKVDAKWWTELVVPVAWMPVAIHSSVEGGVPGMNLGIMGASGGLAGLGRFTGLWAATKDV